jgi:allantoinase
VFRPDLVVRSRRVVTLAGTRAAAIHIHTGKIVGVLDFDDVPDGSALDDANDAAVLPGLVCTQIDIDALSKNDDPFETATRAAASAGCTTIVDVPFSAGGATTTVLALDEKRRAAAEHCFVDVGFWAAAVPENAREIAPLFEAGVVGFACKWAPSASAYCGMSETDLRAVMPGLARIHALLAVHAEPPQGDAIALLSRLCHEYRTHTHFVRVSSSDALTPLFLGRRSGLTITADVSARSLSVVTSAKEREDREFLWAALVNGLIQMVTPDVQPPRSLAGAWEEARARGYSLDRLSEWMSRTPAHFAGIRRKGRIDVGYDADLVVFDPDAARIERVYLRGMQICAGGRVAEPPRGRLVRRETS